MVISAGLTMLWAAAAAGGLVQPNTSLATIPAVYLGGSGPPRTSTDIDNLSRLRAVAIEKWEGPCWDDCIANQSHGEACLPSCNEEQYQLRTLSAIGAINPAVVKIMYFNSFMAFPYYEVETTLVQQDLLLKNLSGDLVAFPNDNGLWVHVPDFSKPATVDLWMAVMVNATQTGHVDGFYADKYQINITQTDKGWLVGNKGVEHYVSAEVAQAWNAGHQQVLHRMVQTFDSMLLHLTVTLVNQYWGSHMRPMAIYRQTRDWAVNSTIPYIWIHPWGDQKNPGTTSLCTKADIVAFLLGVEKGAFVSCQGWDPQFANPLGDPLGPAKDDGTTLSRHFSSGTSVRYNYKQDVAELNWANTPPSPPPTPPSPPPTAPTPPFSCSTAWNCSLNGQCVAGQCQCRAPWMGERCAVLGIVPSTSSGPAIYGESPAVSSWGGNVIKWTDGKFHLFVAEIADGCGMAEWDTNSFVTHAVSDTIEGPYAKANVAAPHWAHNPQVIVIGSELFLFHIGAGDKNSTLAKCDGGGKSSKRTVQQFGRDDEKRSYILSASSPDGPWTSVPNPPICDNPSPWLMSNGTLLLMCSRSPIGGPTVHWMLYSAPSPRGPWYPVTTVEPGSTGVLSETAEDPFLWQDPEGNFHVLTHTEPIVRQDSALRVAGHGFSQDGITWGWSANPYDSTVRFDNGSSVRYSSAERPKLVLDVNGNPTHLINGLSLYPWPCNDCPCPWNRFPNLTNVCNWCKLSRGKDRTYTIMRALAPDQGKS